MIITKKHLSRRTFLRGTMGVAVALPFLDAMVPALSAAPSAPFRFGAIYLPNGVWPEFWHPEKAGKDFEFKQVMKPLEPFRDQVVTVSQMRAPFVSVHLGASSCFLNAVGPGENDKNAAGTGDAFGKIHSKKTVDQYIADKWAEDTPLRSIEVGTEDMGTAAGACDGFPCTFFNTLSWHDENSPLPIGINPRVSFERLFGETGTSQQRLAGLKTKQSMLDSVMQETAKLQSKVGPADKAILDEYLTNVRRVEQQLDRMEARVANLPEGSAEAPVGIPEVFDDHMTVTYDILHLAYQADMSRVFTFLLGHEASTRSYAHIGVPEAHHSISHHGGDPEKLSKYAKIGTYHIAKMAEFLQKLKDTKDGDGNLLDHTLVYWGSGMSNGNAHDRQNVPGVLVGGANGNMKGNNHIVAPKDMPVANLLLGMAHAAGVDIEKMGPSNGIVNLATGEVVKA